MVFSCYDTFMKTVTELSKTAAIAPTSGECAELDDEIAFFQAVKARLVKLSPGRRTAVSDLSHAVRQIVESCAFSTQSPAGAQRQSRRPR